MEAATPLVGVKPTVYAQGQFAQNQPLRRLSSGFLSPLSFSGKRKGAVGDRGGGRGAVEIITIHPISHQQGIYIKEGKEESFEEIVPGIHIELDGKGDILGIEILRASRFSKDRPGVELAIS